MITREPSLLCTFAWCQFQVSAKWMQLWRWLHDGNSAFCQITRTLFVAWSQRSNVRVVHYLLPNFSVAQLSVSPIFRYRFFSVAIYSVIRISDINFLLPFFFCRLIFCCPFFWLPNFPAAQFSVSVFTVAIFAVICNSDAVTKMAVRWWCCLLPNYSYIEHLFWLLLVTVQWSGGVEW